jgi:hypothetical protein
MSIRYVLSIWSEMDPVFVKIDNDSLSITHNLDEATKYEKIMAITPGSPFMWLPYFDPSDLMDEI